MITVLHGDDIVASRNKLTQLIAANRDFDLFRFEGEKSNVTDIVQSFESQSLFNKQKLIILERFIETKNKELFASIINHVRKYPMHEIVFWEAKEIKKELLLLFPKSANVLIFQKDRPMFKFLDSIIPGNTSQSISLLHQVSQNESEELIFYMLIRQFRLLLGISVGSRISEINRLAPWQQSKLERQANRFGKDKLVSLYKKLFNIEQETKTGASALPLAKRLDLFLASI